MRAHQRSPTARAFRLGERTGRSSETGEEIGGVSLYLPDDGTDRGEPHFVYHDPLYALGMSLPDGLTEEVDTMDTRWHNNTIYEWESVELTETGAETNVFSYDEGGLEITVTLDEGAELTAEYDAFGATVYRSDQVNPARRTFFEETDETTCTFESSIFGAQIVLVDGLASDEPDILQVMLYASTSSESYSFIATEDGNNTKRFISQDGLWFVDLPTSYTPTANIDAAVVTVFGPATAEPQELRVVETGNETDVLVTMEYIDSEDTDYPEPSDTTFHFVEVKRWPGICGQRAQVAAVSENTFSEVDIVSHPDGKWRSSNLVVIPVGYPSPPYGTLLQDTTAVVLAAPPSSSKKSTSQKLWEQQHPNADTAELRKLAYAVLKPYWAGPSSLTGKEQDAFSYIARLDLMMNVRVSIGLNVYGCDIIGNCLPIGIKSRVALHDIPELFRLHLGHSNVYDGFLTYPELAGFLAIMAEKGVNVPVVLLSGHGNKTDGFFMHYHENQEATGGSTAVPVSWLKQTINDASPKYGGKFLRIHTFVISACEIGDKGKGHLESWRAATDAYAAYGPDVKPDAMFPNFVLWPAFRAHDVRGPMSTRLGVVDVDTSWSEINSELLRASKGKFVHEGYDTVATYATLAKAYQKRTGETTWPLSITEAKTKKKDDSRNRNLDWRWHAGRKEAK